MKRGSLLALLIATTGVPYYLPVFGDKIEGQMPIFKVHVVGSKVGKNCTDRSALKAGEDVWRGALWACEEDRSCTAPAASLKETEWEDLHVEHSGAVFALIPDNDCQDLRKAEGIALKLQRDRTVLAVIGHSSSKTTARVAEIYAHAGIPLIMAEATAAAAAGYASKPGATERVPNYVRLQPGDDQAQAPAIAYIILKLRKDDSTVFIVGSQDEKEAYSKGLIEGVEPLLEEKIPPPRKVDNSRAAKEISTQAKPQDIVFFAGFRTEATLFLDKLEERYKDRGAAERPIVVLPESCNGMEEDRKNFRIYRTGPADTASCLDRLKNNKARAKWRHKNRENDPDRLPVSMLYGYDGVRLVARAIRQCQTDGAVSRSCVLEKLRSTVAAGACGGYSFRQGENLLSSYYVFRSKEADPLSAEPVGQPYEIEPLDIIRLQDQLGEK